MNYTRFTNVEVTGDLKAGKVNIDLTESTYKATEADATKAAGEAPTKAEFDAVVDLVNELKSKHNKLVKQLIKGTDT